MHPRPKYPSVLGALRKALASGKVYMSDHALGRIEDRLVPFGLGVADVISVLRRGSYEEEKDEWKAICKVGRIQFVGRLWTGSSSGFQ
jgi:hypothetical protein